MRSEEGSLCEVCGSPVNADFNYCPYCGEPINFSPSFARKIPIPLGVVLLAVFEILAGLFAITFTIMHPSYLVIGLSLFNIITGILLFEGYWPGMFMAVLGIFILAVLFLSIIMDIMTGIILVLYMTRSEVLDYFNQ